MVHVGQSKLSSLIYTPNNSVHAVMYGYYYLMTIKAWPKWIPASIITAMQISQMVGGIFVCAASYYYNRADPEGCPMSRMCLLDSSLIYGSYLYFFCDFFARRFIFGSSKGGAKKEIKQVGQ